MHRKMILPALFICISLSNAQINLKGTVKKENGDPVQGARVSLLHHGSIVSLTSATGEFTLSGTKSNDITVDSLFVVAPGYKSTYEKVTSFDKSGIVITAKASNPWIPNGPLEHRKGMVKINAKGHDFEMGQPSDTVRGRLDGEPTTDVEQPVHTVNFTYDFWMDTVEVRQAEYDSIMKLIYKSKYIKPTWNATNGQGPNFATYSVEWGNGIAFCNARSKAEGLPDTAYTYTEMTTDPYGMITLKNVSLKLQAAAYRLPTEAEWEYACKGGTFTDYYWGKNFKPYPATAADTAEIGQYAIFSYNSSSIPKEQRGGSSYYGVNEVARKKPNKYGLYDMLGNVSEWCYDWYDYYQSGPVTDPLGSVPADTSGYKRVRRGGNWGNIPSYLRATDRAFETSDYQFLFCGFRCVTSGISTGIKHAQRSPISKIPSIEITSGSIKCVNIAGHEIDIYSFNGQKVYKTTSTDKSFSISTKQFPAGSYIVKVASPEMMSKTITVLP